MRRHLKTKFDHTNLATCRRAASISAQAPHACARGVRFPNNRMRWLYFVRVTNLPAAVMNLSSRNLNRLSRYIQKDYS